MFVEHVWVRVIIVFEACTPVGLVDLDNTISNSQLQAAMRAAIVFWATVARATAFRMKEGIKLDYHFRAPNY